ncbi:LuxR family transcriptional regulator [Alphaproteobacteria bacterium GH1-50]|uniref:LuxR family transcriptional regulator n=1 Tax=Kangsaoukella pontilimi TaxID=2691042 RepID=A0A7C9IIB6_9RHOB|nr:LuxR family transcriptional regulator [Kangsaoukella pontilimi]MXQ09648.1 LuxR family transcriptional regulator [Kangsaoukella pontilimi]
MLEAFIEQLQEVETFEGLNALVVGLRDGLNVEHIVYHSVNASGGQYAALTYDDSWVNRYIEQDYARVDPVVQACFRRFHPIDWKQLDWSGKAQRSFLGEAIDSGVGNQGFSLPIRGPSGQFALFSISDRMTDEKWARFTQENVQNLLLVSHYINQKALEIERGTDHAQLVSLSPRETDALTMLAMGYSRAKAAEALSISEHTLRVYIESARFKLAALNTTHAVARALASGLLVV